MSDHSFHKTKLLVVGGAGFVGSNLVCKLLECDPEEIWIVDNLLSSEVENIPNDPRIRFKCGSITNPEILHSLPEDLSYVWHLACFHGNQSSIFDPLADHANNALPSLVLFQHLSRYKGLKRVVYAAAGCAVAEKTFDTAHATTESQPISLFHDSPYSISKILGELYGNFFFTSCKLPFVKARFQNVYGPREILGAGNWRGTVHTVWRNVTPSFIWKALNKEALPLDNAGNASRDFIFVEDMARGLMACAERGEPGEVYNLASGVETTIRDLAETINELTGNPTPMDIRPARDWDHSGKRFGSPDKSERELGFRAQVKLRDGLAQTIEWTRKHSPLIMRCMARHEPFLRLVAEKRTS